MQRFVTIGILCLAMPAPAAAQHLLNAPSYRQDFHSLNDTVNGGPSTLPEGWYFTESGTNADTLYRCGDGSGRAGDTYSFGTEGSADRALGSLRSGSLQPAFGFYFINQTDHRIRQLKVTYYGEQWRPGSGRPDSLLFRFRAVTALPEDTAWIREPALDFICGDTALEAQAGNGNAAPYRRRITAILGCLDIRPGEGGRLLWTDADAEGYDDGLAIDDLSLEMPGFTAPEEEDTLPPPPPVYTIGIRADPLTVTEGSGIPAAFYFLLEEPAPPQGLTLHYEIIADDSSAGDFRGWRPGKDSVFFAAGDTLEALLLFPADDTLYEGPESLTCRLLDTGAAWHILPPGSARITLEDDDPVPDIPPPVPAPYEIRSAFYQQNFDGLVKSGQGNYTSLPAGWYISEIGSRADYLYAAGNGSSRSGNTYSLGETDSSDRALGFLQSSSLQPLCYFYFSNATDSVITTIRIRYRGEQWRCGKAGRPDSLLFDYRLYTAADSGKWTASPAASFAGPDTSAPGGRRPGNDSLYSRQRGIRLSGLHLPPGATGLLRWTDKDAEGADDALAVDDLSLVFDFKEQTADTAITLIHDIQGLGSSAKTGLYTVRGVVTALYGPPGRTTGFYLQEEPEEADDDTATSEGIFAVSDSTVRPGDVVQLTGRVQENPQAPSFGQAVMYSLSRFGILSHDHPLPPPVRLHLDAGRRLPFEQYEGMLVQSDQVLTVTGNDDLGRFGELTLSSAGLLGQPTDLLDPDDTPASGTGNDDTTAAAAIKRAFALDSNTLLLLDDGSDAAFPDPVPFLDTLTGTLRTGSTLRNLTGVIGFAHGGFRLQPLRDAATSRLLAVFGYDERPPAPPRDTNLLRIVSFNMRNCFNGDGSGQGFPTLRGADSRSEWQRQLAKLLSAMAALQADIFGLQELENDGSGAYAAVGELVSGLREKTGASYAFITDTTDGDLIRNAILYKTGRVTPVAGAAYGGAPVFERPPLIQAFRTSTGARFTLAVVHLKSKAGGNGSAGNGVQGAFSERRRLQTAALIDFVTDSLLPAGINKILCIGDFNSYAEEDPEDMLRAAGFIFPGGSPVYTYRHHIYTGALDHAAVSPALLTAVYKLQSWPVNSPEPPALDYNDAVRDPGEPGQELRQAYLYRADAFRSSDHDPLLIDLQLAPVSSYPPGDTVAVPPGDTSRLPDRPDAAPLPLEVFPNPASGEVSVRLSLKEAADVTLGLWNSAGKRVYFREERQPAGSRRLSIPLKGAGGLYILEVKAGKMAASRKVILQ